MSDFNQKPFIEPNKPVILEKKLSCGRLLYLYMSACHSTKFLNTSFVEEKYTINFCVLDINNYKDHTHSYNAYSIIIKNDYFGNKYLKLNNADEVGLDFIINPCGLGIGSIILNHLLYWAKENHPDLNIPSIKLSWVDEQDPDNKKRRNRLYEKIGLINKGNRYVKDLTPLIETRGFKICPSIDFLKLHIKIKENYLYKIQNFNIGGNKEYKISWNNIMNIKKTSFITLVGREVGEFALCIIETLVMIFCLLLKPLKLAKSLFFCALYKNMLIKNYIKCVGIPPFHPELKDVIKYSLGSSSLERIDELIKSYEQKDKALYGYLIGGKLVGVVGIGFAKFDQLVIQHISVLKEFRKQGIGAELINHIKAIYKPELIHAETDEEAVGFYQRNGFICEPFINEKAILRYRCVTKKE